jgi:hypothetical protein
MDPIKKPIRTSPYTVYSGIAAEDIAKDAIELQVICPELTPHAPFGTVGAGITQTPISLTTRDGNAIAASVTTANHLVCTWEGSSNTRVPPMIRKGEPVEVYKNTTQDKFYWKATGRGRDFRTTDRVHMEVAATDPTKPGVTKDDTNTYSGWMDSDAQTMGLKNSKANGEAVAFSCQFDLKKGIFHLSDDSADPANRIYLDTGTVSGTPAFQVNLSSGATFKFEGDNAFIKVPGKFEIDAGDRIIFNAPLTVFNLTKAGTFIVNASSLAFNAAKDLVITAGNVVGINAASTKVSGFLGTAMLRATNAVKGAFGSGYESSNVSSPEDGSVTAVSNNADTDMTGFPYQSE